MVDSGMLERIVTALERIAESAEKQVLADPLAMLQEMAESDVMRGEAQEPFASNGHTLMYALPNTDGWNIVARRDSNAESGYRVAIEGAW